MTKHIAEFEGDTKTVLQAMYAAGGAIMTLKMKLAIYAQYAAMGVLAPLGIILLVSAYSRQFASDYSGAIIVIAFLLGFGIISLVRIVYGEMAKATVQSTFGAHQRVEISQDGFDVFARHSQWRTGWSDVTAVLETKDALCVGVSGVALYVPKTALNDPDQALKDMRSWHHASVFA